LDVMRINISVSLLLVSITFSFINLSSCENILYVLSTFVVCC